jgi:ubiquinone/menaquinone biosynthesis C-methylase UbiE
MYKTNINNKANNNSFDCLDNLIHKIFKPLYFKDKQRIKQMIKSTNNTNLSASLHEISKLVTNVYKINQYVPDENRQDFITTKIINYLYQLPKSTELDTDIEFVDIGGGNGNVLNQLATILDIKKDKVICVETNSDWVENYEYNHSNISYMFWDNTDLKIESNSVNCVLCMVSLHHMTDTTIHNILKEIKRILKPDGILLIKEHDTNNISQKYIKWEHYLYHILDNAYKYDIINPEMYLETAIDNFKSKEEWQSIIETIGELTWKERTNRFLDGEFTNDPKNPTNLYWDIYVNKIN